MKYFFGFASCLVLVGCQTLNPLPTTIELENEVGQSVGWAFAIAPNEYLTVDHIFTAHEALLFADVPIEVRQRDLKKDQLIFKLPAEVLPEIEIAHLAKSPPIVGDVLHWGNGRSVVQSVGQNVTIGSRLYENVIVLTGRVEPGDSGTPVYNEKNQVVGLVVGGNQTEIYLVVPTPS